MTAAILPLKTINTKLIYLFDAAGSGALGLALALFADPIAAFLGSALPPAALFWVGICLLPWSAFNLYIGERKAFPRRAALVNVTGDGLWVLVSVAIVLTASAQFTQVGLILFTALIVAVAVIGASKALGLRRFGR